MPNSFELLRVAAPYVDSRTANSLEFLLKIADFFESVKEFSSGQPLRSASLESRDFDMEGMLGAVRILLRPKEQELIDMLLTFLKVQKIMTAYRSFVQNMPADSDKGTPDGGFSPDMFEFLSSFLSEDQQENIEELLPFLSAMMQQS